MNVLIIYPNMRGDNMIPLNISLISASLKNAGHQVRIFNTTYMDTGCRTGDELREQKLQVRKTDRERIGLKRETANIDEELKKTMNEFKPGVIGLSILEINSVFGLELLKKAKGLSPESHTIVGGIYATTSPETVAEKQFVDAICIGEGEDVSVDYCNAIQKNANVKKIRNLWIKEEGKIYRNPIRPLKSLDELPFQDWGVFDKKQLYKPMGGRIYRMGAFELSRGCFFNCTFCCNSKLHELYKGCGEYHREKSIPRFRDELRYFQDTYTLEFVYFNDESFLSISERRFNEFFEMYKEFNLPFFIESRAEFITEERVKKLKEINCEGIAIGVESGDEYIRREVLERKMSNETIIKAFKIIRKYGIRSSANNIVGLPYETRKSIFRTIELNREIQSDSICANTFSPYKGSKLRDVAVKEGYIPEDFIADDYRGDNFMPMTQISVKELKGLQRTFPLYVNFPKIFWPIIRIAEQNNFLYDILSKLFVKIKWGTKK